MMKSEGNSRGFVLAVAGQERLKYLSSCLEPEGYRLVMATNPHEALDVARETPPDIVILDREAAAEKDIQAWEQWRETSGAHVILVTTGEAEGQKGEGQGTKRHEEEDDVLFGYVLDPAAPGPSSLGQGELAGAGEEAREAVMCYDDGTLRIDLERRCVSRQGHTVNLGPIECRLLGCLMRHPDQVVPYEELLAEAWGPTYVDAKYCLRLYIHYLRDKVEADPRFPRYIHTQRGVGYRFAPQNGV
jgi:two-component system KDP operon response regulator KdpE